VTSQCGGRWIRLNNAARRDETTREARLGSYDWKLTFKEW
jgi:hypothetical protein